MFFCFYSVGHHLYDTPASHCDPPKDPNVQYQLQIGHKIKSKPKEITKFLTYSEASLYI